jgi:hypothetical protein
MYDEGPDTPVFGASVCFIVDGFVNEQSLVGEQFVMHS